MQAPQLLASRFSLAKTSAAYAVRQPGRSDRPNMRPADARQPVFRDAALPSSTPAEPEKTARTSESAHPPPLQSNNTQARRRCRLAGSAVSVKASWLAGHAVMNATWPHAPQVVRYIHCKVLWGASGATVDVGQTLVGNPTEHAGATELDPDRGPCCQRGQAAGTPSGLTK